MPKINDTSLVQAVLGHSYFVYFASLLAGIIFDMYWGVRFQSEALTTLGAFLIFLGPLLIYWAQHTSHKFAVKRICSKDGICVDDFYKGPYTFTRSPTHLGIFFMVMGFGFILNSISVVSMTAITFFLTRFVFVRKEERLLEQKYGDPYKAYKTRVKF